MDLIKKYNSNPFPLQLRFVKAINWQSDPSTYDTPLSGEHHAEFQADAAKDPRLLANGDYDTAGWWLHQKQNGLPTTPSTSTEHFSDTWKKPNHITFSTHSQYSAGTQPDGTPKVNPNQPSVPLQHTGGEWSMHPGQDHLPENQRTWNFTPHPSQVQSPEQHQRLTQYFEREEMPHGHTVTINGQVHQPGMQKGFLRNALDRLKGKAPEPLQPIEDAPSEPKLEQRSAPAGFEGEIKGIAEKFLQQPMTRADANRTVAQGAAVAGVNPGGTIAKIAGAAAPMVQPIAQAASGDIAGAATTAIKNLPYKQWLAKLATSVLGASQAEFEAVGQSDHSYETMPDPAKIIARPKIPYEADAQARNKTAHDIQHHIKQKIGWGGGKMATKGIIGGLLTGGANGEGDINDEQAAIAMHGLGPLHDNGGAWVRHATPQQIAALTGISLDDLRPSWSFGKDEDERLKTLSRWMGTGTSVEQDYWIDYLRSTMSLGNEVAKHLKIDPNSPQFQHLLTRANLERLCVEFGAPIRFDRGGYADDSDFGTIHGSPIINKFLQNLVIKKPRKFPMKYSDLTIEERKALLKLLPALSLGGSFGTAEQYSPESKETFDKHLQETKQKIDKELENPQTQEEIETIKEKHQNEAKRVQKEVDDEYNRQQEQQKEQQKARERQKKRHEADARGWGLWDRQRALADTIRPSGQQRLERSLMRKKINRLRKAISQQPGMNAKQPGLDDPSQATPPSNMLLDEQGRTVAHRLHNAYTSLNQNPSTVRLDVPGGPNVGGHWLEQRVRMETNPSEKPVNLANHPGQNLKDMLHHDVVVAMHHRLLGSNADYAHAHANGSPESLPLYTGIGRDSIRDRMFEPVHRLYNELQGMARYSGSEKLSKMFPWQHRDEQGRVWSSTPGRGRDFGNRVMYHGTLRDWEGPIDPSLSTLGPTHEGGAGFYGSSRTDDSGSPDSWYSARHYTENDTTGEDGPLKKYQLGRIGPGQLKLWDMTNVRERDYPDRNSSPQYRKGMPRKEREHLLGWFTDMAQRYNQPNFVPQNLKNSLMYNDEKHNSKYSHDKYIKDIKDLANVSHDMQTQMANMLSTHGRGPATQAALSRYAQLESHLMSMGLTAAGYDGTVNRRPPSKRGAVLASPQGTDLMRQQRELREQELQAREDALKKLQEQAQNNSSLPQDLRGQMRYVLSNPNTEQRDLRDKLEDNQAEFSRLERNMAARLNNMNISQLGQSAAKQNIIEARQRSRPITDEEIAQGIRPDFWPNGKNDRGHVYTAGYGPLNEFYSLLPVSWNKARELPAS